MKAQIKKFLASKIGKVVEQYLVGFAAIFGNQYLTKHDFHAAWKSAVAAVIVPAWFKIKDAIKAMWAKKIASINPVTK
jgi:hypothetical protein